MLPVAFGMTFVFSPHLAMFMHSVEGDSDQV